MAGRNGGSPDGTGGNGGKGERMGIFFNILAGFFFFGKLKITKTNSQNG